MSPPEIPATLIQGELSRYDWDESGLFSADEIAYMVDSEVAILLGESLRQALFSEEEVTAHLRLLNPHKAFRTLSYISKPLRQRLFRGIFASDLLGALRILRRAKESAWEPSICIGQSAADLIQYLPLTERAILLGLLSFLDSSYAHSIDAHITGSAGNECDEAIERLLLADEAERPSFAEPFCPIPREQISTLDRRDTVVVPMRGYAISNPDYYPYLVTLDVGTCVVLTLYEPVSAVGIMTHIDVGADLQNSLDRIFQDLSIMGLDPSHFEARIVGGWGLFEESERLVAEIVDRLGKEDILVVERDYLNDADKPRALVLDSYSGDLYDYEGEHLESDLVMVESELPNLLHQSVLSVFSPYFYSIR